VTTTNNPYGQHDLPKTYLRRFSIDPNNRKLKSFIYCFWTNTYESKIEKVSIDSEKFKKDNFYTVNHDSDPYVLENFFKTEIEPLYNKIMLEVESEVNLSIDCRHNLIIWLFYNKYRNKANRDKFEKLLNFLIEIPYSLRYGKEKFKPLREEAKKIAGIKAKEVQLLTFIKEDLFKAFEKGIGTKHWIVLKSKPNNRFLTNDNPGFSIDIEMGIADINSLNNSYSTNHGASNYFVLTPEYCLLVSPFWEGTPLETSIKNQEIEFKITNDKHIDFINHCTTITRTMYIISNSKSLIEKHIQNETET